CRTPSPRCASRRSTSFASSTPRSPCPPRPTPSRTPTRRCGRRRRPRRRTWRVCAACAWANEGAPGHVDGECDRGRGGDERVARHVEPEQRGGTDTALVAHEPAEHARERAGDPAAGAGQAEAAETPPVDLT